MSNAEIIRELAADGNADLLPELIKEFLETTK